MSRLNVKLRAFLSLLIACLVMTLSVYAQSTRATIVGTVKDSSSAVLPGVSITAKNTGTGLVRNTITNETGDYTVPLLPIGTYEIAAELSGFSTQVKSGITLQVDDRLRIDFAMEIGQISDRVVVTASAPLIQSENASIGNVIDQAKIIELPLDGREFFSLAQLNPAVYAPAQGSTIGFRGGFNVAGSSEIANAYMLDGVDNTDSATNQPSHRPSIDSIQEFKVLTGTYSAEYGRHSGGQILITTKSGTNEFHGSAYNFYRNSAMDARNFFASSIAPFTRNQFGGTLGGPILNNRTFFFGGYEGLRADEQMSALATVPTVGMRRGDFSELLNPSNPFTNRVTAITDPQTRLPFSNNIIPLNRFDRVGNKLIEIEYPIPNLTGSRNYRADVTRTLTNDQYSIRIDHKVSEKNNLSGGYQFMNLRDWSPLGNALVGTRVVPGFGVMDITKSRAVYVSNVHVFSPNFFNELRVGYTRLVGDRDNEASDRQVDAQLAIPGLPGVQFPGGHGGPQVTVSGFATVGNNTNIPQNRADGTGNLVDMLIINRGNHALKLGFDTRYVMNPMCNFATRNGSFSFNGFMTGYAVSDLLMGYPRTFGLNTGHPCNVTTDISYNAFFQNDWKVSDRLTLNLGMRYEYNRPIYDRGDRIASFDPATNRLRLPKGGEAFIDAAGQMVIREGAGDDRAVWDNDKNNFAPRIGIAYRPFANNTFVVRMGYGIFYNMTPSGNGLSSLWRGLPYSVNRTTTSSTSIPVLLSNPLDPSPGRAVGRYSHPGVDRLLLTPYVQQYSFGLQKEINSSLMIEATFMGSRGVKLFDAIALNQPTPGAGSVDARRPYQPWGGISYSSNMGRSWYDSLQMKLEKRMAGGISGLLSYTFGKSTDTGAGLGTGGDGDASAQNPRNYVANKGLSTFDVRHRLVASYVIDLPFGKGRRFINSLSRPVDMLLGGWQISGILSLQSGTPFTPRISFDNSNTGTTNRPNLIGDWHVDNPAPEQWFNKNAFCYSASCGLAPNTYGNAGRNILIGPGRANLDFSVLKSFAVRESHRFQFRGEFFNLTNHPNFFLPDGIVDLGSGGTISQADKGRTIQLALKYIF